LIAVLAVDYPVEVLCELLEVICSGYYRFIAHLPAFSSQRKSNSRRQRSV
jgi:hypothetical protein